MDGVMGVLSWRVWLSPNFQRPLAAKLCVRPQKFQRCKNVLEVLYHHAKFGGLGFHPPPERPKTLSFFVCLFVTLSVCSSRFWTSEIVRPISPWRRGSTETILMPLDRGRFVVVHPCSTFSDCCQLAASLNAEVQKTCKNWSFWPTEGDKINRSRRNLAHKRILWVCCSTPNSALIGKRGSV